MDEKDFDIEMQAIEEQENPQIQLPLNFLSFGEIDNDDVKVYIHQDVYKALEKLSSSDTTKELGSILLGDYAEELGKTHVIISASIDAKYTDASASTLTFTHKTWEYVHKEHSEVYPEKKIIGWQHTHPNYGIFLSNYDMFIQENFFNLPFQIAYVIDPIQNIRGFFQWKNGKIEKLKGYYIYDEIGKPIKIEQKKLEKSTLASSKPNKAFKALASVLCVLCLSLGISLLSLKSNYEKQLSKKEKIISEQSKDLSSLQDFMQKFLDSSQKMTVSDLIAKLESEKIAFRNHEVLLSELHAYVDENNDNSVTGFLVYTVEPGDTLSLICEKNDIMYESNMKIILAMNGIENADTIYAGQNLLLPVAVKN